MPLTEAQKQELKDLRRLEELEKKFGSKDKPSMLMSTGLGAAQSATAGFADEIEGAIRSGGTKEGYEKARDKARARYERAEKENPKSYTAGQIGGGAASMLLPGGLLAKALTYGAASGLGGSKADLTKGEVGEAALDTAIGTGTGGAAYGILGKALPAIVKPIGKAAGKGLSKAAEMLAEKATGATRVQAEKFAKGAGRTLLDEGIVKFGSSPKAIAKRAADKLQKSGEGIDEALKVLDDEGALFSRPEVRNKLERELVRLQQDESKSGVAKKLEKIIEEIASKEEKEIPLSQGEAIKRSFQKQSNYTKPNTTEANKITASTYRQAVEDEATKINPSLAKSFKRDKDLYGILAPIEEASSKRAIQQAQHPILSFKDLIAGGAGAAAGDPTFGAGTAMATRLLAPRLPAAGAVSMDMLAKIAKSSPGLLEAIAGKAPGLGYEAMDELELYNRLMKGK